jgi:hypothetical protein
MKCRLAIVTVLALTLGGCASGSGVDRLVAPSRTPATVATPIVTPTPIPTPTVEPAVYPATQVFGGDCGAVLSASDATAAVGTTLRNLSEEFRLTEYGESITIPGVAALSCYWLSSDDPWIYFPGLYLIAFDSAIVPFADTEGIDCKKGQDGAECTILKQAGGLWFRIDVVSVKGTSVATGKKRAATVWDAVAGSVDAADRAGVFAYPAETWEANGSCETLEDVDFSGVIGGPTAVDAAAEFPSRDSPYDPEFAVATDASGAWSCRIGANDPKKSGYPGVAVDVYPGLAWEFDGLYVDSRKSVAIDGATDAAYIQWLSGFGGESGYFATSGPNLICVRFTEGLTTEKRERSLAAKLISALNGD